MKESFVDVIRINNFDDSDNSISREVLSVSVTQRNNS